MNVTTRKVTYVFAAVTLVVAVAATAAIAAPKSKVVIEYAWETNAFGPPDDFEYFSASGAISDEGPAETTADGILLLGEKGVLVILIEDIVEGKAKGRWDRKVLTGTYVVLGGTGAYEGLSGTGPTKGISERFECVNEWGEVFPDWRTTWRFDVPVAP